ncbi:putative clathrin assembly protein At4g40080 [Gossypium raimondii]|uniref:ENTH domain-containing protein n=1 Tax=Gossypium raimondii TaxID=29730 RepID=A0A0D2TUC5_GOSRA|nr:putative clathrin assembly protein At4g40080 [Gossypium raimondii]KJB58966.1 hypothetical protein B456_009G232900 [Gossypium raimondii]MBA0595679.1 hypothetical protein [Gossypium raimondii]
MGYRKNLRIVCGNLKDKGSLIKTVLSSKPHKSAVRCVILRATTHGSSSPPSNHRIAAVISLGLESKTEACSCIQALMDRLHSTSNALVALKCLYTIHNIIGKGFFILKDQLSMYEYFGGRNFLKLLTFRDDLDPETREMSKWVRWYAAILEQNLLVSKVLGCHLYSKRAKNVIGKEKDNFSSSLNSDLLNDIDALVEFACQVGDLPDSLHLQRKSLVYEIVRSVGEDYRLVQREIGTRVAELEARMMSLSSSEWTQFLNSLTKFEDCKEGISLLFRNRNRNDELWDLVKETKAKLVAVMKERGNDGKRTLVVRFLQRTSGAS